MNDKILVGVSGSRWLIAREGETNGDAWVYDKITGELFGPQPLQVWFKFGTWQGAGSWAQLEFHKHKLPDAIKAWLAEKHPRHPAGTPVDPVTGAGGGRFAPKGETMAAPDADSGQSVEEAEADDESAEDSAHYFDKRPTDAFQKAVDRDAVHISKLRNEYLYVYDAEGNARFTAVGASNQVNYDDIEDKIYGLSKMHNHPNPSVFSPDDLITSMYYDAPHDAAVAGDIIYRIDLPREAHRKFTKLIGGDKTPEAVVNWIEKFSDISDRDTRRLFQPYIDDGSMSIEEATAIWNLYELENLRKLSRLLGGDVKTIERIEGFFTEPEEGEKDLLKKAHEKVRNHFELTFHPDIEKDREPYSAFLFAGDQEKAYASATGLADDHNYAVPSGADKKTAAAVYNTTITGSSVGAMPGVGAVPFRTLRPIMDEGIGNYYFAGLTHAYRLRIKGNPLRVIESKMTDDFERIVEGIRSEQELNYREASAQYFGRVAVNRESTPESKMIQNHLAYIELAKQYPDVFEYKAVFYPGYNLFDAAKRGKPVNELIG